MPLRSRPEELRAVINAQQVVLKELIDSIRELDKKEQVRIADPDEWLLQFQLTPSATAERLWHVVQSQKQALNNLHDREAALQKANARARNAEGPPRLSDALHPSYA